MPTPLQILLDPVSLAVLGIYAALILLEALFPGRVDLGLGRAPGPDSPPTITQSIIGRISSAAASRQSALMP